MTRLETVEIASLSGKDRRYSPEQVIAILDGGVGGNRIPARGTMPCSYLTWTVNPTVYFTALRSNGTVLAARTTAGVVYANGLHHAVVTLEPGMTEFVAVWDEGTVSDFVSEEIVVDT